MRKALILAFQKHEQAEQFLSNLEGLKRAGSVQENLYNTLKKEYLAMREQSNRSIKTLKADIQQNLIEKKTDFSVFKDELQNLETRFKVGQLTSETFLKKTKVPKQKAEELEHQITCLQTMLDATNSHVLQNQSTRKRTFWPLFSRKAAVTSPPLPKPAKSESVSMPLPPTQPPSETVQQFYPEPEPIIPVPEPPPPIMPIPMLTVTDLSIMPDRIEIGGTLGITAQVYNNTAEELTDIIELKIDEALEQATTVTIYPAETREITFIITANTEGIHTIAIGNATGTFTVV
ncbi:MAG TPA: hypothetical protein DCX22_00420 [Dehalococcoidia bacterium]|nr:hypothetical protein [Dehalococcoidia bacterium]